MGFSDRQKELVKDLTKKGTITGKDAAENLDERDVKLVEDADSTPMYYNEKLQKGLRSKDNRKKARSINSDRKKRAVKTDRDKQADTVFEDPLTDQKLDTWKEKPNEFDIKGIDSKNSGGLF